MIMFTILLIAAIIVAIVAAYVFIICGAGFFAIFGDSIVFGLIIALLFKLFRRKKRVP